MFQKEYAQILNFFKKFFNDHKATSYRKKHVHKTYKCCPTQGNYEIFQLLRSDCKRLANECYKQYLKSIERNIHSNKYFGII